MSIDGEYYLTSGETIAHVNKKNMSRACDRCKIRPQTERETTLLIHTKTRRFKNTSEMDLRSFVTKPQMYLKSSPEKRFWCFAGNRLRCSVIETQWDIPHVQASEPRTIRFRRIVKIRHCAPYSVARLLDVAADLC